MRRRRGPTTRPAERTGAFKNGREQQQQLTLLAREAEEHAPLKKSELGSLREKFHKALLAQLLTRSSGGTASNADKDNETSRRISLAMGEQLGALKTREKLKAQSAGVQFERCCADFVERSFHAMRRLRPGNWLVLGPNSTHPKIISGFEQYEHLSLLYEALKAGDLKQLKSHPGTGYLIAPDILIARLPEPDDVFNSEGQVLDSAVATHSGLRLTNNQEPILHASISCNWTMCNDRAQNCRSEALNLIRNRKGRTPHISVITAEPLPSRLASLALGTGDLDCVYHIALPELERAVESEAGEDAQELMQIMVSGKRLRDISDLPLDLAI